MHILSESCNLENESYHFSGQMKFCFLLIWLDETPSVVAECGNRLHSGSGLGQNFTLLCRTSRLDGDVIVVEQGGKAVIAARLKKPSPCSLDHSEEQKQCRGEFQNQVALIEKQFHDSTTDDRFTSLSNVDRPGKYKGKVTCFHLDSSEAVLNGVPTRHIALLHNTNL